MRFRANIAARARVQNRPRTRNTPSAPALESERLRDSIQRYGFHIEKQIYEFVTTPITSPDFIHIFTIQDRKSDVRGSLALVSSLASRPK